MMTVLIILNTITIFTVVCITLLFHRIIINKQKRDNEFKKCVIDTNIWSVQSIKYVLVAMCRYIDSIKHEAVKEERYEDAKRCQEVIKEINKLIDA